MSQSLTMSFTMRILGHIVLSQPPKGLKTEVRHMVSQQCLCNGTTVKILDAKAQVSLSGWQFHAYCPWEQLRLSVIPQGEDNWRLCIWNPAGLYPMTDSNLYLLPG